MGSGILRRGGSVPQGFQVGIGELSDALQILHVHTVPQPAVVQRVEQLGGVPQLGPRRAAVALLGRGSPVRESGGNVLFEDGKKVVVGVILVLVNDAGKVQTHLGCSSKIADWLPRYFSFAYLPTGPRRS